MKQKELKKLISDVINCSQNTIEILSGSDNPQVLELWMAAKVRIDTLEAVIDAINNNRVMLRIMAQ